MKLALAIAWTACLITDIMQAAAGMQPSWMSVFCPLICLTEAMCLLTAQNSLKTKSLH